MLLMISVELLRMNNLYMELLQQPAVKADNEVYLTSGF